MGGTAARRLAGAPVKDILAGCQEFCGAPVTGIAVRLLETKPLKRFDLPSTTVPFCLVATLIWVGTAGLRSDPPLRLSGTDT